MRTIWKYNLPVEKERDTFYIPKGGTIVYVACQRPRIVSFWVEVDDDDEGWPHRFVVVGSGHGILTNLAYCGTAIDGLYVWHLYEKLS